MIRLLKAVSMLRIEQEFLKLLFLRRMLLMTAKMLK